MNYVEQLLMVVLKGCPYVVVSLYSLHVPSGFGGRAGFDTNISRIFPQGVLAAISLVGAGAGEGGARAGARCEVELSLYSVDVTTLLGVGSGPKLLEQKP